MSAVIGVLVVILRLQGGSLHEAQIKLLRSNLDAIQGKKDEAVKAAKLKLQKALKAYYDG